MVVKRVGCSGFIDLVAVTIKSGLQRGLDDLGIFGFGGDFWIWRGSLDYKNTPDLQIRVMFWGK